MRKNACVCGDIVEKLPLAQSTVSEHLKVLKEAGLIRGEVNGASRLLLRRSAGVYHLQTDVAALTGCVSGAATVDEVWGLAEAAGFERVEGNGRRESRDSSAIGYRARGPRTWLLPRRSKR